MLEFNQPVSNPVLVAAMNAFKKNQNPRTELDMIHAFLGARLLSPVNLSKPLIDGKPQPDSTIQHCLIINSKEEKFFLAFTDEAELAKWAKEEHRDTFLAPIPAFAALLEQSPNIKGVSINPFGENLMLTKEMIENFPKRRDALMKVVPPRFMVGKIPEEKQPKEMMEALSKYFKKKQKSIQEAWIFLSLKEGDQKPRLMLIVDYDGEAEDAKEMFPEISEAAKPHLRDGEELSIMRRDEKFAAELIEKTEPFYRKKTGLFW